MVTVSLKMIPPFDAAVPVGRHAIEISTCTVLPTAGNAVYLNMGPCSLSLSESEALALSAELARAVTHFRTASVAAGGVS